VSRSISTSTWIVTFAIAVSFNDYAMRCVGQLLDWSEDYLYVSFDDNLTVATMERPQSAPSWRLSFELIASESPRE
jgi:hypothetical protein